MFSDPSRRLSALRSDIREEIARESGMQSGGGDFYAPFWRDAKDHVTGQNDLITATSGRISNNGARANLYPRLQDGFLVWWNQRRRWTNAPFTQIEAPKAEFVITDLNASIKIDNLLSVQDDDDRPYYVYPYFSPEPALTESAARLGLWVLEVALPRHVFASVRILDVIRGRTFSTDRIPLIGNEEEIFKDRYRGLLDQWDSLREEY